MKRLILTALILCAPVIHSANPKLAPADIVGKSITALGAVEIRAQLKYQELTGTATMRSMSTGGLNGGTAVLVSEGRMVKFATKFGQKGEYPGDQFVFDGNKVMVSNITPGRHSSLGEFFWWQQTVLREGLFGGVLSTAWPLYDLAARKAELSYDGTTKVDGRDAHQIVYRPKKSDGALSIRLLFDAETFRHVKTIYDVRVPANLDVQAVRSEREQNSVYRLEETFSEFRQVNGLTLPTKHKLTYSVDASSTQNWVWEITYNDLNGVSLAAVAP
ncbi:MAG TPA: hypothetical protein VN622_04960 [Clostridia bacterium]|nr:hypothetical protein [Clostridia bacterium]